MGFEIRSVRRGLALIRDNIDAFLKNQQRFDALGGVEGHQTRDMRRAKGSSILHFEELYRVLLILKVLTTLSDSEEPVGPRRVGISHEAMTLY